MFDPTIYYEVHLALIPTISVEATLELKFLLANAASDGPD